MYTVGTAGFAGKENRILYIGVALAIAVIVIGGGAFLNKRYIKEEQGKDDEV